MRKGDTRLKRAVAIAFSLIMLALMVLSVGEFIQINTMYAARAELTSDLNIEEAKLRKQKQEYDQIVEALPNATAQMDLLVPQAESLLNQVTDLRAQRKQLRSDIGLDNEALLDIQYRIALAQNQTLNELLAKTQSLLETFE